MSIDPNSITWDEQPTPPPATKEIDVKNVVWNDPQPQEEKSLTRKVVDGFAYVGRVLSGQEQEKTLNELSQKVQSDINTAPDGIQKNIAQGIHNSTEGMQVIQDQPLAALTEGIDAAKEQNLKEKAIDLISKAESLDETSLYSSQIKQLWNTIGDKAPTQEEAQKLQELQTARLKGYDKLFEKAGIGELGVDASTGEKYLIVGDKHIPLDNSLIDELQSGLKANSGVAVGAMSGAYQGAKYSKNALGALIGGAVGAFGGSLTDTALNASATDKEIDTKLALQKASEEAVLDPIMTLLTGGAIHVAGKPFALASKLTADTAEKVKNFIVDSNIGSAKKVLTDQGYTADQIQEIVDGVAKFQKTTLESEIPRDNIITKTIGAVQDEWNKYIKSGVEQTQNSFVDVAMQDPTLINQLEEVLAKNPKLSKPVSDGIIERSKSVQKALQERSINPLELRSKIDLYEQGVKSEYAQTKELIQESIPDARFSLKDTNIPQTISELEQSIGDTNVKNELLALSHRIGKKEEMNASEFIDVREDINRILRKGSVQSYADKEALSSVKQTLDDSLNIALKDAPIDANAIKTQFENAVTQYRAMKELQDTNLYAGVMGDELSIENISSSLMKGVKTVDGTLDSMLSKLNKADRERVEHSVILDLHTKSQKSVGDQKATDFIQLYDELSKIDLKNIKSESARKTINDLKEMSRFFKNDPLLLEATTKAKAPNYSQGLSANPVIRMHTRLANAVTNFALTYNPLSPQYAFRYHLKQSLKRSRSPIEFMSDLIKHPDLPPSLLETLQNSLKEYQKEMLHVAQTPQELKEFKSAQVLMDKMDKRVEKFAVEKELTDNTLAYFTKSALPLEPKADILSFVNDFSKPIKTPLFESSISFDKLLNHLADKKDFSRRIEYVNLIKPTLENPLFITKEGDRYRFFKTFMDQDKTLKFLTVVEDNKGNFIGITATPLRNTDVRNLLKEDIVWGGDTLAKEASTPHNGIIAQNGLNEKKPTLGERAATFTPPSAEELKVVEPLVDLDTQKAIIAIKEGKATDPQKVKYLDAKEAIGQEHIDQQVAKIQANAQALKEKEQTLLSNPRLEELLSMRENVTSNDAKYAQRQIGTSGTTESGDFYKSTNTQNFNADFELLGSDVKRIRDGRVNEAILTKLENDLGRLENDPLYKELPSGLQNQIFSRGALSAAGSLNGVTVEDDGTISFDSVDALKGMAIGAGLELFGSRLLKGDSMMRRGSIGIVPDKRAVQLYSKAESVIAEKMPQKMETTALEAMLKKAGVKDEEIAWSGIKALKGKVSKEEVEATLGANKLELNEIIKTDPQTQRYLAYTEAGGTNYKEYLLTLPNLPSYSSKHWDENNIVAFMRTKDRAIENKNSLFIEEIQSDWHQDGRKKGYEGNIPEAPFKTSWPELAIKRLIKEAIDNGYEQIAWTTGAQQAKRYSLTKSLKEINYKVNGDGTYTIDITHQNGARDKRAYIQPIDIQDHIGKELSERVLKNEGNGVLNSSNLQIENKGMNTFYDTIIPTAVKKLLKVQPHKVKVGDQEVWSAAIKQNRAEEIQKSGLPLYSTIGGTFSVGVGGSDGVQ